MWRLHTPPTPDLVTALLHPDPHLAPIAVMLGVTDPAQRADLFALTQQAGSTRLTTAAADHMADALTLAVTGSQRWTVQHVWERSRIVWPIIDGTLQAGGVDVLTLPPDAATNAVIAVWMQLLRRGDGSAWQQWLGEVTAQPARAQIREIATMTDEDAAADFAALSALAGAVAQHADIPASTQITVHGQTVATR